jgi:hypothetical protein
MALATTGQLTSIAYLDRSQAGSQTDMRPARSHPNPERTRSSTELLAVIDQLSRQIEPLDLCKEFPVDATV